MNRYHFRLTAFVAAALLAACSDAPLQPRAAAKARTAPPTVVVPTLSLAPGLESGSFTIDPVVGGTYIFNGDGLTFPAGSICDPAVSSYGQSEWDKPCEPLMTPITISVQMTSLSPGHLSVEFEPALRFVPSDDPAQWVTLAMTDATLADLGFNDFPAILWRAPDSTWVDESLNDATLATQRLDSLTVFRRIKHFSGYMVGSNKITDTVDSVSSGILQ